jgi:hypothetical protein
VPAKFDHRTFVRLDEGYDEHPKVMPLSDAAFRAHVEAILWASRNEARYRIPKAVVAKKWRPKVVRELVDARLFDDDGDVYEVHDYLDFNRSAEEIAAFRESRGDAGSLGNHKRWHVARRRWDKDCSHCKEEGRIAIAK